MKAQKKAEEKAQKVPIVQQQATTKKDETTGENDEQDIDPNVRIIDLSRRQVSIVYFNR
jgi:lysyl-tRNA synthetase, class II